MKLSEILEIDIDKEKIINEKNFEVLGILDSLTNKKMCTFIEEEKYITNIKSNISMIITTSEIYSKIKNIECGFYITEKPRIKFFSIHNELCSSEIYKRKKFKTTYGNNCIISDKSSISSENVIIGNNVVIEEFVVIKENVTIDDNTIIRAGTVIGSSGFEYKRLEDSIMPVNHIGGVHIGKNVEIKCNTVIDKAIYPWDNTEIGDYTKIDNLNHIGHACKIGKDVMMPAGSVIGGRVVIEDGAWVGIGSIIRNGITIGENSRCNMGSIVTKNVKKDESVSGNFAIPHSVFIENIKKWSKGI